MSPAVTGSNNKVTGLPAYTTILSQVFSPTGDHLAVGSARGRIAIFRVTDLVSAGRSEDRTGVGKSGCLFYFDVSAGESSNESVNTLSTTKAFLIASVSSSNDTARILAWSW